ncbi:MAG: hypothetical protein D6743_15385, partial [Calditrichaeota bacterium]
LWLIDEANNTAQLYRSRGPLTVQGAKARTCKEDVGRLKLQAGTELVYRVPGQIRRVVVKAFQQQGGPSLEFGLSTDDGTYQSVPADHKAFAMPTDDYPYQLPVKYTLTREGVQGKYLKITARRVVEIGRVEIEYQR